MGHEGRYLYCVADAGGRFDLGKIGIGGERVFGVRVRDISGVVSAIPFESLDAKLPDILNHQKVVEACWNRATTLPVRFGVIFKNESAVKQMLSKSYEEYRSKLTRLEAKDEFGMKVILDEEGLKRIKEELEDRSEEIVKLKRAASKSTKGASYLLKLKIDEALRAETAKKIEGLTSGIYEELSSVSIASTRLRSEHDHIALNAAYLVGRDRREEFQAQAERVKGTYEGKGLKIHMSGPWAPYSFC